VNSEKNTQEEVNPLKNKSLIANIVKKDLPEKSVNSEIKEPQS
jgi:hypothetical protein